MAGISNTKMVGSLSSLHYIHAFYMHPFFDPVTIVNDIALIQLKTPINLKNKARSKRAVTLVSPNLLEGRDPDKYFKHCYAIGWGTIKEYGR